jgi:hypothetical protein
MPLCKTQRRCTRFGSAEGRRFREGRDDSAEVTTRHRTSGFLRQPSRISICFLPKRRASIDQAPGPSMANAAPRVPNGM